MRYFDYNIVYTVCQYIFKNFFLSTEYGNILHGTYSRISKGGFYVKCIYIDVLVILNWYINYFILLGTAKLTHTGFKRHRLILSSFIGGISALIILIPTMNYLINIVIKYALSIGLVYIAFEKQSIRSVLKNSLYCCVISFIFAGMMYAIQSVLHSNVISTNNSYVYANFSITFLIVSTAVCYGVLCVIRHCMDKNSTCYNRWSVTITYNKKSITIDGLADTGNALTDIFSGKPVIVCSKHTLEPLTNVPNVENITNTKLNGFRLIPYSTIAQGGVIVSFIPDSVQIIDKTSKRSKMVDVLIGVSGTCKSAIFNPKILI